MEAAMSDPTPDEGGWVLDEYDGPRFWAHVDFHGGLDYLADPLARIRADAGECWLWSGWNSDGYGIIRIWGKILGAHRISYRDFGGTLSDEQDIDHLCRVHACVRPNHLEPVTHAENILRGANARH
jgi:hypothetical protein